MSEKTKLFAPYARGFLLGAVFIITMNSFDSVVTINVWPSVLTANGSME